jgi:hypothetical protein
LRGLGVRVARALNRVWRRSGRVLGDRPHEHVLRSPREVRWALAYVLQNARKHGTWRKRGAADPWFDGWRRGLALAAQWPTPVARARSWLLGVGWRRHGLLDVDEVPVGS